MVAFTGPSSTTSSQMSAMKRPSDVPPVQESSGSTPGDVPDGVAATSTRRPRGVRNGLPQPVHVERVLEAVPAQDRLEALLSDSRVLCGE